MPDLTSLALPDAATNRVEAELCTIHAAWLERLKKNTECCRLLFDVIAEEILAVHAGGGSGLLELLPGIIFDVAIDKGWIRLEVEPVAPPNSGGFRHRDLDSDRPWFPVRRDWFGRGRGSAPSPSPAPKNRVRLGQHDVREEVAKSFRAVFAGRVERLRARTIRLAIPPLPDASKDELIHDTQPELTAEPTRAPVSRTDREFQKQGNMWVLTFDGKTVNMGDTKGISYLSELLMRPGRTIPAIELRMASAGRAVGSIATGSAGAVLDDAAISQYRRRLAELEPEIAEAERNCDLGQKETLEAEKEQLEAQVSSAVGLGGRRRNACDDAERARKSVSAAISRAIVSIRTHHCPLADHLQRFIDRGQLLMYKGDGVPWNP